MEKKNVWTAVLKHGRRRHRPRCRCCERIIQFGERVMMTRHAGRTVFIHEACADEPHPCGTFRDAMEAWGAER